LAGEATVVSKILQPDRALPLDEIEQQLWRRMIQGDLLRGLPSSHPALINIPYFLAQPDVLWGLVFTAMNLYQIVRIYMERRPVVRCDDEQKLYDMGFHALRPREFVSLVLASEWENTAAGDRVLREGQPVPSICIPISRTVHIRRQGHDLGALQPGCDIGTAMALTGEPSPVEATFTAPGRYMCWPLANLRSFVDKRPELRVTLQRLVNRDVAEKLEGLMSR
jgi:Popeye protein conserved region